MRTQIHQMMDACLFALSFWLAYQFRASEMYVSWFNTYPIDAELTFDRLFWFYLASIPLSPLILESQGFYDRPMISLRRATLWALFRGCLYVSLGLTLAMFFAKLYIARSIPLWFGLFSFTAVYVKEELLLLAAKSRTGRFHNRRRFILAGTPDETARMRDEIRARPESGVEIVSELDLNNTELHQIVQMLHDLSVNGVILSTRHTNFDRAEAVVNACELEGVEAWLVADFFKTQISRTSLDDFYGHPMLVFRSGPQSSWQALLKQVIDFSGALVLLLILALPLALVTLILKFTSPGPVFFRQARSGLNGAPFTIYKFRTMVTNAEQIKHELAAMNEMSGPVFKIARDPRITPFGKWLRRFSVDEFPQLFNVLRGEMSLVGPRPLPVDETKRINDLAHRRRLSVKPGLTCLWQISGRNEIKEFGDWVRLDLEYIDNWSLWLDFKILLRTVPVVFVGTGAK
jgi:exopolysaccharide biosynthesis polyprenyl glycosylphosphotransferase